MNDDLFKKKTRRRGRGRNAKILNNFWFFQIFLKEKKKHRLKVW